MPLPHHQTTVRKATPSDSEAIIQLVHGLAEYEKLTPPDPAARQRLIHDMFSDPPRISALLAEADGIPVGYAFYFFTYSSFLALPTLYLEDLFVLPDYRKRRAGLALFQTLVSEAVRLGCGRMEWTVLDWNALAINFYQRLGAQHMKEWHLYRLTADEMRPLKDGIDAPR